MLYGKGFWEEREGGIWYFGFGLEVVIMGYYVVLFLVLGFDFEV